MADSSDNDQERTLPATPRRLEQARDEGQVPRSRALASAFILGIGGALAAFGGPLVTGTFADILQRGLAFDHRTALADGAMLERLASLGVAAVVVVLPICVLIAAGAVLASMLVGGWLVSTKALEPKWDRLNPIAGLQKLLSRQQLVETAKTILEALVVVAVVGVYIWLQVGSFGSVLGPSTHGPFKALGELVLMGILVVVLAVAFTAAVDVPVQIWRHGHNLRMSLEEVKRETRETEGDPHQKAHIRAAQREIAKQRMMQEVPKANVVVTNPTHFAVALRYDEAGSGTGGGAPRVVAKGRGVVARRIRELAAESGVPLVEAPPLARALHASTALGAEIPQALYTAVAQVLAFVFRLKASAASIGAEPFAIDEVSVPAELDPGPDAAAADQEEVEE